MSGIEDTAQQVISKAQRILKINGNETVICARCKLDNVSVQQTVDPQQHLLGSRTGG